MSLFIVTATTDPARASVSIGTWLAAATGTPRPQLFVLENGAGIPGGYRGTVPAFRAAVDHVLATTSPEVDVIACLHDDVDILEAGWDETVLRYFARHPAMGLAGFGGAVGLGTDDLYRAPYDPMQLARIGFRSNLVDAEVHGARSLLAERVACLDGFSQIGRRDFWLGQGLTPNLANARDPDRYAGLRQWERPWSALEQLGVLHHGYDGMLGCLAKRYGWETWYLPIRCRHLGGQTAVGDAGYQAWAATQHPDGDRGLWQQAHAIWYDAFRDVLPMRI